jgi:DNA-binding MarR family transcriptional regulator
LRQVEYSILALVETNDKVTHKRLSTALGVAAPNLTIVLDRLEQRQLVKRTRSPHDGRVQYIQLTPRGRTLHGRAKQIADTMEDELLSHFSAGERTMLFGLLQKPAGQRREWLAAPSGHQDCVLRAYLVPYTFHSLRLHINDLEI